MSKFVFLLFAFLIIGTCADDATSPTENDDAPSSIEEIKNQFVDSVNGVIEQINQKILEAQEKSSVFSVKLEYEGINVTETVYEKVIAAQKKVAEEVEKVVNKLESKAVNMNITECADMVEAFNQASLQALKEADKCVVKISKDAAVYIKKIIHTSDVLLKKLISIRDEAKDCVKDADGNKSNARTLYCFNMAAAKGTWAVTKKVPSLISDIEKLNEKISGLLPKMALCSTVRGVIVVIKNASDIRHKVHECVEAKKALAGAEKEE